MAILACHLSKIVLNKWQQILGSKIKDTMQLLMIILGLSYNHFLFQLPLSDPSGMDLSRFEL